MKHNLISSPTPTDFHISTSNNNVMDMGMDVDNSSELSVFFLLSSTLYKEPYRAIVRELVSNAIDASKRIGANEPVILHVPKTLNDINNEFYVQDFGIGMSLEQVINIYGNYFASSKQNDSNSIGGFGLGGKTPFIYVKDSLDGFKLETTSPEDGVRRTFMFYMVKNEHGGLKPVYRYLEHLDVENSPIKGSKISFKLHDIEDITNFTNAIDDVLLSLYPIQYTGVFEEENVFDSCVHKWMKNYIGEDLTLAKSKEIYTNLSYDKLKMLNDSFCYFDYHLKFRTISAAYSLPVRIENISLILGNIFYQYPLDSQNNSEINKRIQELDVMYRHISQLDKDYQIEIGLPIFQSDDNGNITLSLSRDNIQKTEHNDKIIIDSVNQYLADKIAKTKEFLINMLENRAKNIQSNYHKDNLYHDNGLYGAYEELINFLNINQCYKTIPQLVLEDLFAIKKQYENMIKGLCNCFIAEKHNHSFEKQSFEKILKDVKRDKDLFRYGVFRNDNTVNKHDHKLVFLIDSVSKIKTRKQKDIVFENFLNEHINKAIYSCHIVMSSEQYDIVNKFGTQFKKIIDLNPSIQPLIEKWKSSKSKSVQNNQSKKDSKESIKSKLLQNESNGFYMINFEDGFQRNIEQAKLQHDLLPKHLNLDIVINPITLPKTIKLDINHRLVNPTFIKNIQFLIKIGALRLNNKNILINESFLSKTNYFIENILNYSKRNKQNNLFNHIPSTVFKPISNIIQFDFIDNNQFADLDKIDIFQYINDEINARLDDVYKQLEKQIDFKDFFFTSVAKRMFSNYYFDLRNIFSPFDQLITKDEKILKDILLNKMADVSEEVLNQYFNDEQPIMKYMMFSDELDGFVDYLKYHFKHMGLSKQIKTFNDFFEKHGLNIMNKIIFRFPHDKTNKAGFKYSKELYSDYIKPILTSFDES